jgi:hypothetical protein
MQIRESPIANFSKICEFMGYMDESINGLMQTRLYCGLIWLKIRIGNNF